MSKYSDFKPLISIIVPVYNVEKYMHRCLDSILGQTYTNLEIILVDDGSPDNSGKYCDEYASLDNRVSVIHKANGGLSDARNTGIDRSTGRYIMFVDSDDYIALNMVEMMYNALEENDADLSVCNFKYVSDDGTKVYDNSNLPIKDECISPECFLKEKLFNNKYHYWIISSCKLYKKELFNNIRFEKGKIHEDEFIIHKIIIQCNKIACVSDMLYFYVQRDGSIMHSVGSVKELDSVEALCLRAYDLSSMLKYKSVAPNYLKRGIGLFYRYYKNNIVKKSQSQKERNKEIQSLYRVTYSELRKNKVQSVLSLRIFLYLNYISLRACSIIYKLIAC